MKLAVFAAIAATIFVSGNVGAEYSYSGPIVVRMGGASCRGSDGPSDVLLSRGMGTANWTSSLRTVYCPISRRNTIPYGKDFMATEPVGGDTVVNLTQVNVYVAKEITASTFVCNVYGYKNSTNTTLSSPPITVPSSEFYSTVTFNNPLSGTFSNVGLMNIGLVCNLPVGASIIGLVASFG